MRSHWLHLLAKAIVLAIALPSAICQAKEGEVTAQQAKVLMQQAFMKSKSADRLAEYDEVVELASKSLTGPLSEENRLYARSLVAWGQNRRGEHFLGAADEALARSDDAGAAAFHKQALAAFDAAIAADAATHLAWFNRAVLRSQLGREAEALADLDQAVAIKPDYGDAWFNRGLLHAQKGELTKAADDFTKAIRLAPQDFAAYLGRARAYARLGKYDEAIRDCDGAIKVAPKNPIVFAQRADIYLDLGKWSDALADYRRAIEVDPRHGPAHVGLAWILATCPDDSIRQGNEALSLAQRAVAYQGPGGWRALDAQAAAEANLGKFTEAKGTLEKALAVAPPEAAERLRKRLLLYEQGKPFRESPRGK